jgi:hypothetical protein
MLLNNLSHRRQHGLRIVVGMYRGIHNHRTVDINDVERFDDMLAHAITLRVGNNARDIFKVDLPTDHWRRAFERFGQPSARLGNPSMLTLVGT